MTPRILVIDDDDDIRRGVGLVLTQAGFTVVSEADGKAGIRRLFADKPDLVLLDVLMPDLDGWQTIERIRDMSAVPVLMLTARGSNADKVRGLDLGADDYLVKPFSAEELTARVRALLRRVPKTPDSEETIDTGDLTISLVTRQVFAAGKEMSLSPLEFRVLHALVRYRGQVLSEEQLLALAWSDSAHFESERVKFVVHRLRRKLSAFGVPPERIESVRGFGYRYQSEERSGGAHSARGKSEG